MEPRFAAPTAEAAPGEVRWQRSSRALRVSLRIDVRTGQVVVTLPQRATRRAGAALLRAEAAWVRESLAALAPHIPFAPDAVLPIGGVPHRVRLLADGSEARIEPGAILVPGPEAMVARRLLELLRGEARRRIAAVAARHAAALGTQAGAVRLKDTRSRWGSCAADGTLAFSWRLVMAPDWVLDHVVAHEVAHLREMNHSAQFWALLARLSPQRGATMAWLRANGPGLLRIG
ncbi:MAG: M48 family metallopeptidase [Acetobacteraceae bacterium]|nr:M48 family metallopeptidase [Acetobacteraceae bacterium]